MSNSYETTKFEMKEIKKEKKRKNNSKRNICRKTRERWILLTKWKVNK